VTPRHASPAFPKKRPRCPKGKRDEALNLVADLGGPTMCARIGVMMALNRHIESVFDLSRTQRRRASDAGGLQNRVRQGRPAGLKIETDPIIA
jgi:hypothetical protein